MKLPPFGKSIVDKNPKLVKIYAGSAKERWDWAKGGAYHGGKGMVLLKDDSFEDFNWPVQDRDVFVFDYESSRKNALTFAKLLIESGALAVTVVFHPQSRGSFYVQRSEESE